MDHGSSSGRRVERRAPGGRGGAPHNASESHQRWRSAAIVIPVLGDGAGCSVGSHVKLRGMVCIPSREGRSEHHQWRGTRLSVLTRSLRVWLHTDDLGEPQPGDAPCAPVCDAPAHEPTHDHAHVLLLVTNRHRTSACTPPQRRSPLHRSSLPTCAYALDRRSIPADAAGRAYPTRSPSRLNTVQAGAASGTAAPVPPRLLCPDRSP